MKRSKLLLIISLVVVLSILAIALPATPALAAGSITLSPATATGTVGSAISVIGTGFTGTSATIKFSTLTVASSVPIVSGGFTRSIVVPTLPKGTYPITVTTTTSDTATADFAIIPYITLSSLTGNVGSQITVSGNGFSANSAYTVTFGTAAPFLTTIPPTLNNTSTTGTFSYSLTIPAYPKNSYTVAVTTVTETANSVFTINSNITLTKADGLVGEQISVSGNGFAGSSNTYVYFDNVPLLGTVTTTSGTFSGVTITLPEIAGGNFHSIRVADSNNNSSSLIFTIKPKAAVTPASVLPGKPVTISGKGFSASSKITLTLDNTAIATTVTTNALGTIPNTEVNLPAVSSGNHTLKIADAAGLSDTVTVGTSSVFTVLTTSGTIGTDVMISGSGFGPSKIISITFNGLAVTLTPAIVTDAEGKFSGKFKVPNAASGTYTVSASDSIGSASDKFIITSSAAIAGANSGTVGTDIVVAGNGFSSGGAVNIQFDNVTLTTAKADVNGTFTATIKLPAGTPGLHNVVATDGVNKSEVLKVTVTPTFRDISVKNGPIGTEIAISGDAFTPGSQISIKYDSGLVANGTVSGNGSFSVSFKAPVSKYGNHTITATDGVNSKDFSFAIDSTPPAAPALASPIKDTKAETPVKLQWNPVTSINGSVTYTLQISQDANFGTIILEKKGLTTTSYQLTDQEKLKSTNADKPYYWRVNATDAASSVSAWSVPSTFTVGFIMPGWLLWIIYIVVGVFILAVGFVLGRRLRR